jgi:hypothetical protein
MPLFSSSVFSTRRHVGHRRDGVGHATDTDSIAEQSGLEMFISINRPRFGHVLGPGCIEQARGNDR